MSCLLPIAGFDWRTRRNGFAWHHRQARAWGHHAGASALPAGERAMYCDSGYFLLGLIIEKASRQSYSGLRKKAK